MAGIKSFSKLNSDSQDLNRVQDKIEQTFKPILESTVIDGQILPDLDLLSASDNLIEHKLGRELRGWIIIKNNTASTIFDKQDTNTRTNQFLILSTSADTTISLWVF